MAASRVLSVTVLLVALSCQGFAFKQELWLYLADGNSLYFDTHVPDMSDYAAILPKVNKYCARGMWYAYSDVNYGTVLHKYGYVAASGPFCWDTWDTNLIKSLRHWGEADTMTDAISLYAGAEYNGTEVLVTGRAFTGISHAIGSVATTGTQYRWMLFEGQYLDGKSYCFKTTMPLMANPISILSMADVGSVFRGCDLPEIEAYRKSAFACIASQNNV